MNRVGWMLRVGLCLLALSCLSRAATGAPSVEANALFKAGQAYQKQAESAKSVATASALLEKAIEQYNRATRLQPDFHSAHALCSQCLLNLARYTTDPDQRRAQIKVAFERFDVAAKCSGTDWTSYQSWGQILLLAVDSLAAGTEDRRYILNEAHQAFEAGRPLTRFRRQRAEIESKLATCLALLAQAAHDEAEKLLLYRQAVERFDSVAKEPLENPTADYYAVWGMTLLRLGKLEHQLEFIRQATERLEKCLEKDPRRATPHYNLACCHALLNQPDEALRQLRLWLDTHPAPHLYDEARVDPDLQSLHSRPEFALLVSQKAALGNADKLLAAGVNYQKLAEQAKVEAEAAGYYEQAVVQYEQAAQLRPDFAAAQTMWASCLVREARLNKGLEQRRLLIQSALEHCAVAARCSDVEWKLHSLWGDTLITEIDVLAVNAPQRRALLDEARQHYEAGLALTRFNSDRVLLELGLGVCAAYQADTADGPDAKRRLYREAVAKFDAVALNRAEKIPAATEATWGLALFRLGKLDNDRALIRLAVERMQTAVEHDPNNLNNHYNLACAFARLNQPEAALRHLSVCVKIDQQGMFRGAAAQDPDLKSLQRSTEFEKLLEPSKAR